jgi:magnesium transporter
VVEVASGRAPDLANRRLGAGSPNAQLAPSGSTVAGSIMLTIYDLSGQSIVRRDSADTCDHAIWVDLLNPSKAEERDIERLLAVQVPTREEMGEIEISSRLYQENGAHFMTATIIYQVDTPEPAQTTVTFILTATRLVTVRYAEPKAFPLFLSRAGKGDTTCDSAMAILIGLLEAIIDREADLIERLQGESEKLAQTVFGLKGGPATRHRRYDVVLKQIGKAGEIASKARESLLSLERVLTYLNQVAVVRGDEQSLKRRIKTETRDVQSLADHLSYLNNRLTFMLDATLGMVSIEQNQIVKLFSVMAVILMPPTLVASIYGMNFRHMPELGWEWGYPMAVGLMVLAAVLPFLYFKRKGWL